MRKMIKQKGKGSKQELLPNRHAVNRLTGGEAWERSINNYAKVTPSGVGAMQSPSVMQMAQVKY
jgi:hypothetical protein